ncbi:hypothetical protein D3C71_2061970 [compost metagenome]
MGAVLNTLPEYQRPRMEDAKGMGKSYAVRITALASKSDVMERFDPVGHAGPDDHGGDKRRSRQPISIGNQLVARPVIF